MKRRATHLCPASKKRATKVDARQAWDTVPLGGNEVPLLKRYMEKVFSCQWTLELASDAVHKSKLTVSEALESVFRYNISQRLDSLNETLVSILRVSCECRSNNLRSFATERLNVLPPCTHSRRYVVRVGKAVKQSGISA